MIEAIEKTQIELAKVEALNHIDENKGQLDYYSKHFPVKWPCALVDIIQVKYENQGIDKSSTPINRQIGQAILRVIIANLQLSNTSGNAPISQQQNARSIWTVKQQIHNVLQGFRPAENMGQLIRTSEGRTKRDDGVQEYFVDYAFKASNV